VHDISDCIICKTKIVKLFGFLVLKNIKSEHDNMYNCNPILAKQAPFDTETNLKTIHTSFVKEMNQFEQSNAM